MGNETSLVVSRSSERSPTQLWPQQDVPPVIPPKQDSLNCLKRFEKLYQGVLFDGIFNHVRNETETNPQDARFVEVISCDGFCIHGRMIFDPRRDLFWHSSNYPGRFLTIKLLQNQLFITGYAIETQNFGIPQSWALYASTNGDKWDVLDEHNKSPLFTELFHAAYINVCPSQPYQYFQIRQLDLNKQGDNYLAINQLEFFGKIFPL